MKMAAVVVGLKLGRLARGVGSHMQAETCDVETWINTKPQGTVT